MAVTAIVRFGEHRSFRGASNMIAVRAIVHFGEHYSFWGAINKSAGAISSDLYRPQFWDDNCVTQLMLYTGEKLSSSIF